MGITSAGNWRFTDHLKKTPRCLRGVFSLGGCCLGIFLGLFFVFAGSVVGSVKASALIDNTHVVSNKLLHRSAALGAGLKRFFRNRLKDLERPAFLAFVLVDRHSFDPLLRKLDHKIMYTGTPQTLSSILSTAPDAVSQIVYLVGAENIHLAAEAASNLSFVPLKGHFS